MGMMYPDGTFIIKGIADAMRFKVFGDVIYPGPIEEVVSKYPGVKDVSVSLLYIITYKFRKSIHQFFIVNIVWS